MKKRFSYTYVVLRYRHDPLAEEFANVGVVLHAPADGYLGIRVRKTLGRLGKIFPGLVKSDLTTSLNAIERAVSKLASRRDDGLFPTGPTDASELAARALPKDDSSYIWGPLRSGTTDLPAEALNRLYERFVSKYDEESFVRRDDSAIWQPVRERLAAKKLLDRLQPKTVVSPLDTVEFGSAWKNGVWHCYQALSFDLMTADGIREKAARWSGHMLGASRSADDIKPYFLVGAPSDKQLVPDYERAIKLLRASALDPSVYEEAEADTLVSQIERNMRLTNTEKRS